MGQSRAATAFKEMSQRCNCAYTEVERKPSLRRWAEGAGRSRSWREGDDGVVSDVCVSSYKMVAGASFAVRWRLFTCTEEYYPWTRGWGGGTRPKCTGHLLIHGLLVILCSILCEIPWYHIHVCYTRYYKCPNHSSSSCCRCTGCAPISHPTPAVRPPMAASLIWSLLRVVVLFCWSVASFPG